MNCIKTLNFWGLEPKTQSKPMHTDDMGSFVERALSYGKIAVQGINDNQYKKKRTSN